MSYYANAGTSIGTITATDADVGSYGVLTYSIDQSHLGAEYFAISSSGEISVKTTPQGSALSYASSATVVATASDVGALTDTAEITIIISGTSFYLSLSFHFQFHFISLTSVFVIEL